MLKEVQDVIMRIEAFLEGKEDFETVVEDEYLTIRVFPRNGEPSIYHGYELFLMEQVVQKLDSTLDFKIVKDGDVERFVVTTDANYNLGSYINRTNNDLFEIPKSSDDLSTVFLCEKLSEDCRGEFSILTGYSNGTWTRCDITKAELLYAAVNDLTIEQNQNGIFWYSELIEMNSKFFDELESFKEVE